MEVLNIRIKYFYHAVYKYSLLLHLILFHN